MLSASTSCLYFGCAFYAPGNEEIQTWIARSSKLLAKAPWGGRASSRLDWGLQASLSAWLLAGFRCTSADSLALLAYLANCSHTPDSQACASLWKPCAERGCDGLLLCSGCARRHIEFSDAPCNSHSPSTVFLHVSCKSKPPNPSFCDVPRQLHLGKHCVLQCGLQAVEHYSLQWLAVFWGCCVAGGFFGFVCHSPASLLNWLAVVSWLRACAQRAKVRIAAATHIVGRTNLRCL